MFEIEIYYFTTKMVLVFSDNIFKKILIIMYKGHAHYQNVLLPNNVIIFDATNLFYIFGQVLSQFEKVHFQKLNFVLLVCHCINSNCLMCINAYKN